MRRPVIVTGLLWALVLCLCPVPGAVSAQSLAEIAARERARREEAAGAAAGTKVITEEDLAGSRPGGEAGDSADEETEADRPAEPDGVEEDTGDRAGEERDAAEREDEEAKRRIVTAEIRGRYKAAEEAVERARSELDEARAAREEMPTVPPVYTGEVYGPIMRADQRIERAEIALGRAERRLDEIADEARRAGVYPGDLRD